MVGSPQCMKNAQNNKTKNIIETTTAIKQLISHGELVEPFKNLFKISADWIQSLPRKKRGKKKKNYTAQNFLVICMSKENTEISLWRQKSHHPAAWRVGFAEGSEILLSSFILKKEY